MKSFRLKHDWQYISRRNVDQNITKNSEGFHQNCQAFLAAVSIIGLTYGMRKHSYIVASSCTNVVDFVIIIFVINYCIIINFLL